MKPPDIGLAKRAAIMAQRCGISHRPDLMQALALAFLRGTIRKDFQYAPQVEPPKVK